MFDILPSTGSTGIVFDVVAVWRCYWWVVNVALVNTSRFIGEVGFFGDSDVDDRKG